MFLTFATWTPYPRMCVGMYVWLPNSWFGSVVHYFFLFGSVTRAQTTDLSWTEREDASADVFAHTLPGRTLAAKCHATTYH